MKPWWVMRNASTYAIVKPAKAPPSNTRAIAVPRYAHKLASAGSLGRSSSSDACAARCTMGSAFTRGAKACKRQTSNVLMRACRGENKPLMAPVAEEAEVMACAIGSN